MGTEIPWRRVLGQMKTALQGSGLDLLAPLSLEWYNAAVPPALHLPYLGRELAPLAILVGNSKAIWEPFISALRSQPSLLNVPHPLDAYVQQTISAALMPFDVDWKLDTAPFPVDSKRARAAVYWDHETRPGKLVAMQRLAVAAGVAFFDDTSNLCLHPSYGSWFALRAVVLFDVNPPADHERPVLLRSSLDVGARERVADAKQRAIGQQERMASPVKGSAFKEFDHWRLWLEVRDAIQPDHPMRYEFDQIEYHYTHNKDILHRLVSRTL